MLTKNIVANNLSEGRFQVGREVIDCRSMEQKKEVNIAKLAGLRETKTRVVNGVRVGEYVASRLLERNKEEERKRRRKERVEQAKKREVESVPVLGRDVTSNGMIALEEDETNGNGPDSAEEERRAKMRSVKARLEELQRMASDGSTELHKANNANSELRKANNSNPPSQPTPTGNAVFDSLVRASTGALDKKKEEVLSKRSAYAEKELREQLRIAQQREELLEKKEEEKQKMMSLDVVCYWCHNCKKFVENGLGREYCENAGHYLEIKHEKKRMFECMQCHMRRSFIGCEKPTTPCGCGSVLWNPCSFFKEKKVKTDMLKITPDSAHLLYCHESKSNGCLCLLRTRYPICIMEEGLIDMDPN